MAQNNRIPMFRDHLRELMGDLSTTDFAKKIGLSRQTVGFYLNGDRIPDCETLAQICSKCDVSADWLLGLSKVKTPDIAVQQMVEKSGLYEDMVIRLMCIQGSIDPTSDTVISYYKDCPEWIADNTSENLKYIFRIFVNLLLKSAFDSATEIFCAFYPAFLVMTKHYNPASSEDEIDKLAELVDILHEQGYAALTNREAGEWYISKVMDMLKINMLKSLDELEKSLLEDINGDD